MGGQTLKRASNKRNYVIITVMRLVKENYRGLEAWTKGSHLAREVTLLGYCPQLQG